MKRERIVRRLLTIAHELVGLAFDVAQGDAGEEPVSAPSYPKGAVQCERCLVALPEDAGEAVAGFTCLCSSCADYTMGTSARAAEAAERQAEAASQVERIIDRELDAILAGQPPAVTADQLHEAITRVHHQHGVDDQPKPWEV